MEIYPPYIFDDKPRNGLGRIKTGEPLYSFYDRMAKPGASERRERINELFSRYPDGAAKGKFRKQLLGSTEDSFMDFLFELYINEQLQKNGILVEAVEPVVSNGKAPDFLCSLNGRKFYAEVVSVSDRSAATRQVEHLVGELAVLHKTGFIAALAVDRCSSTLKLDVTRIRFELKNALAAWNDTRDNLVLEQPGWRLKFKVSRATKPRDGFIFPTSYGIVASKLEKKIATSLRGKAKKYGDLDYPLVLFLNIRTSDLSPLESAYEATTGSAVLILPVFSGLSSHLTFDSAELGKRADGVFQLSSKSGNLDSVIAYNWANILADNGVPHVRFVNPCCSSPIYSLLENSPTIQVDPETFEIYSRQREDQPLCADELWFHNLRK